jgi:sugar-phosphatase
MRGLDPEPFIRVAYGRRISETLRLVNPGLDVSAEVAVLDGMEEVMTDCLAPVPGVGELLRQMAGRWGIVTSGSSAVATLRLTTMGIPIPEVFVTAEQVRRGKPEPDGYLAAARRMDLAPADCLVVEDAPPGVAAGKAAGMPVIAVLTTHRMEALTQADGWIESVSMLRVRLDQAGDSAVSIEW